MQRTFNNFGEITCEGCDIDGTPIIGTRVYPTYTCGHCSNVVVMRPDRERPRKACLSCGKMICEKSEICATHCTPLHAMANDHFENAGEHGKYVKAIMTGILTKDEAAVSGLLY